MLIYTFVSSSYLPWFEIYYKLLNTLADYLTKQQVMIPFGRLLLASRILCAISALQI